MSRRSKRVSKLKHNVGSVPIMSINQMEAEAGDLSSYNGEYKEFSDYDGGMDAAAEFNSYDGFGDHMVDYEGGRSSIDEINISQERIFRLSIVNGGATDEEFYLNGGLDITLSDVPAVDGLPVQDGPFNSIAGNPLSMKGDPQNFKQFYRFVQANPLRILGLKVASTVATQLETSIIIQRQVPFKKLQDRTIFLGQAQHEGTFQDKIATINEKFQFDNQTKIKMTVKAGSTMNITLYGGTVLNTAKALHKKALLATNNTQRRNGYQALAVSNSQVSGGGRSFAGLA